MAKQRSGLAWPHKLSIFIELAFDEARKSSLDL